MHFLNFTARHSFCTSLRTVSLRGRHRAKLNLQLSQKIHDFQLCQLTQLPSSSQLLKFQHPSGLTYYHLDSPTLLNTFAILLPTHPSSHQATSYIVQKMIQCGDTKYKIKDIIQQMKNRSFNEINTTETTEDYYLFPFQTKSKKDFMNLLDVYLNMVYCPRMEESDFKEARGLFYFKEGNEGGYLGIKGGVYEESFTGEQLLEGKINGVVRRWFRGKEYSVIGRSDEVIGVGYDECLNYHERVFNLGNSVFYTHGDMNPVQHIQSFTEFINNIKNPKILSNNKQPELKSSLNLPPMPQTIHINYLEGITPVHSFLLSYKLPSTLSPQQHIQLNILSCLLFDFPESPFTKYLSQIQSYPKMYGYRDICFNIGYSTEEIITDYSTVKRQKELLDDLTSLVENKFDDGFVEAVLNQLESDYYTEDGYTILQHISNQLCQNKPFISKLNIHSIFENLRKDYRRKNIFQNLIQKHFLNNQQYLRIICEYDKSLQDKLTVRNQYKCIEHKKTLSQQQISNIANYSPTQQLQNPANLPIINANDYQIFEELVSEKKIVNGVPVVFVERERNISQIVLKIDITDIDEEHVNMIELYKNILPRLGSKNTLNMSYDEFINKYITGIDIELLTSKSTPDSKSASGLKLYLLLKVQFLNNNIEYAFNILNNCILRPNFSNLERISEIIMAESSRIYSNISQDPLYYGTSYVSSEFNPFLKLEDKLFHARSFASVAADIMKVANSKHILEYVGRTMEIIHRKITEKKRYNVYVESKRELEGQIDRYLQILVDGKQGEELEVIDIEGFMPGKIRTYFPNFKQSIVFEGFKVPYLEKESPALTLLGSIIDSNIKKHKKIGGCYTYKGGLISYLSGGLKQFLELQKFYQDIDQVETGKRRLFQRFNAHTAFQEFKYNFDKDFVKSYKQAILATELSDIRHVVHKYIFEVLKEEGNSQVMMGPHLADYSSLMKTGWTIQRILEDMSLTMETSQVTQRERLIGFNRLDIV